MDENAGKQKKVGSKLKYSKNGQYIFMRLDLSNPYEVLGILSITTKDVEDLIQIPKKLRWQQQIAKQNELRGGTGVINEAKKDKSFFKRFTK